MLNNLCSSFYPRLLAYGLLLCAHVDAYFSFAGSEQIERSHPQHV